MASERPIRRKPCSHANNFESLIIAFRNRPTYVWGGGGDGGKRGWGRFKWFSGCHMLTVIFFLFFFPSRLSYFSLSISFSLSHHNKGKKKAKKKKKKKNACTRTPKFLCIFLRNDLSTSHEGNSLCVYLPSALKIATLCDWNSLIRMRKRTHIRAYGSVPYTFFIFVSYTHLG